MRKGACGKEYMTLFHDVLEILILFMISWTFFCEKAPAAKNGWHLFMTFHDFLEIIILFMICWTFVLRKGACGKELMTFCVIVHVFLEILVCILYFQYFCCEKAAAANNKWHLFMFSWFSRNSYFFMIFWIFLLRKGACGKE